MAQPTPLEPAPELLAQGRRIFLKREDGHELGAFKWRGALPALAELARDGAPAVVTASTGNHGAATAWAAERLGLQAIVFVPETVSRSKLRVLEQLHASIRPTGPDLDQAKDIARAWAAEHRVPFFEDGAEPAQLDGYGVIADELLDQLDEPPGAVIVPVGNGALLGGIGRTLAARSPGTRRIGVAAREAPVMVESWHARQALISDRCATFADGLGVRVAIPFAVDALADAAQEMLLVSERELAEGVAAFAAAGIRVEGAGAAAFAALPHVGEVEGPIVLVVTGRNIDEDLHRRAIEQPESFPA